MPFERSYLRQYALPAVAVLLVALVSLSFVWQELGQRHQHNLSDHFAAESARITAKLGWRMGAYAQVLRGAAGLFAASDVVTRAEWKRYVEKQELDQGYRGIQGVGFAQYIAPAGLDAHVRAMRRQGFPDYVVKPAGSRSAYSSIVYLEPFSGRNLRAFGYDMYSEPVRRAAMERARDAGTVSFSGKVKLVQETCTDVQAGILAYHPVYANDALAQTVEQRRAALRGWVYSPYRMNDLIEAMLRDDLRFIHLQIFDGDDVDAQALLYDSESSGPRQEEAPAFSVVLRLNLEGRPWTLRYAALPGFAAASRFEPPWVEFAAIIAISLLLFAITWALTNTRRRAESLAGELTASLRQSELKFREQSKRLAEVIWGTNIGTWEWNVQSGEVVFNERWAEIAGYRLEELAPISIATWRALAHPEDVERSAALLQRCFERKDDSYQCEARMRHKNGEWIWVLDRGRVVEWASDGKPVRMSGTHQDITERKLAETKLASLLEEQQAILQSEVVGIVMLRARAMIWMNKAFAHMLGYEAEELTNQPTRLVYADDDAYLAFKDQAYPVMQAGGVFRTQIQYRRKDGSMGWFDVSGAQLRAGSQDSIWAFVDISAQKRTEEQLIQAQQAAQQANQAKTRFLATMSHEIRTPMNGILGMAQLLLQPGLGEVEREAYARTMLNSGQALLTLLNDILDLSKVEAGKFELDKTAFAAAQIVQDTQTLYAGTAASKGLDLQASWSGPPAQRYLGDPLRLRQMLSNLLGNAVKFTERGEIRIEAREVERAGGEAVLEFAVIDSGIGISVDKQHLLFHPFSQADSSTTRQYGGTGLGLSIVSSLAQLMGGGVGVDSEEGRGSRFWFRVRVGLVAQGADSRQQDRAAVRRLALDAGLGELCGRVLVVEDNLTNRVVIEAMLGKLGLSVVTAEDGQQGVDVLSRGEQVDLVLMDVQMPVLDGCAATQKIRQWEQAQGRRRLPVVALTAGVFKEDREHCLASDMDDFIAKPVDIVELRRVLEQWLRPAAAAPTAATAAAAVSAAPPERPPGGKAQTFDEQAMLSKFGGDRGLAKEVIQAATQDLQDCFARLEQAISVGNWKDAQRATHTLKGLTAQIGGVRLAQQLRDADERLKRGERIDLGEAAQLRGEYAQLANAMGSWMH